MKNTYTSILILILLHASFSSSAKIWRVNNNTGVPADFTTGAAAITGAAAGDTIYFEPSTVAYGDLDIIKRLVIIGPGYWLAENGIRRNHIPSATVGTVTFRATNASSSAGSIIRGMVTGNIHIQISDITIENNHIQSIIINNSVVISNILIAKNWIPGGFTNSSFCWPCSIWAGGNSIKSNVLIKNNFLGNPLSLDVNFFFNGVIYNNIFNSNVTIVNSIFYNNILNAANPTISLNNSTSTNNLSRNGAVGSEDGNISNIDVDETPIFVGGSTIDNQFNLHANSPAKGAGIEEVDCGMFGGQDPYVLSGVVNIPAVTRLMPQGSTTSDGTLKVKISAVANK
jgi:hypothetical protein